MLDATELLSEEVWRRAESGLRQYAEQYFFPVRVLVLSYQSYRFATEFDERRASEETFIPLGPLGPSGATALYTRATQGHRLSEAEIERLMAVTGGVPMMVRILAGDPGGWEQHPDGRATVHPVDVLCRYADRVIKTCGTIPFGTKPGHASIPLFEALAIATLARQMGAALFDGFSRALLPPHPALHMTGTLLDGVEPPLLGFAFLFRVDREATPATRAAIAQRAWQESPEGVASMLRHFWLSVARTPRFGATDDRPSLNDPTWFRTYDALPADSDASTRLLWLTTRFDLLRSSHLEDGDHLVIEHDVTQAVSEVQSGSATAELTTLVTRFWCDQTRNGNVAAWRSLDALQKHPRFSDGAMDDAWLAAAPVATFHLLVDRADEALALFDRIIGRADAIGTLDARRIAAWTAVALSRSDRPDMSARLTDCASGAFWRMPSDLLDDGEITAAWSGFLVNAIDHYGADQRWGDMAAARGTLDRIAARFPDNPDIQLERAKGAFSAITHYGTDQRWNDMAAARDTLDRIASRLP